MRADRRPRFAGAPHRSSVSNTFCAPLHIAGCDEARGLVDELPRMLEQPC